MKRYNELGTGTFHIKKQLDGEHPNTTFKVYLTVGQHKPVVFSAQQWDEFYGMVIDANEMIFEI